MSRFDRFGDLGMVVYSFRDADQRVACLDRWFDRSGVVYLRKLGPIRVRDIQNCYFYRAFSLDRYDSGILHDVPHDAGIS